MSVASIAVILGVVLLGVLALIGVIYWLVSKGPRK